MLKIDYRLVGSGWAECTIHPPGLSVGFTSVAPAFGLEQGRCLNS
jgi:hypothetical protein